jgi:hypothetical protein
MIDFAIEVFHLLIMFIMGIFIGRALESYFRKRERMMCLTPRGWYKQPRGFFFPINLYHCTESDRVMQRYLLEMYGFTPSIDGGKAGCLPERRGFSPVYSIDEMGRVPVEFR